VRKSRDIGTDEVLGTAFDAARCAQNDNRGFFKSPALPAFLSDVTARQGRIVSLVERMMVSVDRLR